MEFANIFTLEDTIGIIDWSVSEADLWLSNPDVKKISDHGIFTNHEDMVVELQGFFGLGENAISA